MLPTLICYGVGYTGATDYRHLPGGGPEALGLIRIHGPTSINSDHARWNRVLES